MKAVISTAHGIVKIQSQDVTEQTVLLLGTGGVSIFALKADKCVKIYGTVDVLVNNVGGGKNGPLHTLSSDDLQV